MHGTERVTIIKNNSPILIICPHGVDDIGTAEIGNEITKNLKCNAVINNGYKRSNIFDYSKQQADCNNYVHCLQDVVRQEFLDPIINIAENEYKKHKQLYVFYIHGMGIKNRPKDLDIVLGCGSEAHKSCRNTIKNAFLFLLTKYGFSPYVGKTLLTGKHKNNLNQLFVRHYTILPVQSMQIEIVSTLRTPDLYKSTSLALSRAIDALVENPDIELKQDFVDNIKVF